MPRIGWMRPPARWVIPLPVATLSITMLMRRHRLSPDNPSRFFPPIVLDCRFDSRRPRFTAMAFKTSALYCLAAVATLAGCASTSDVDDVRRQLTERDRASQQRLAQIESKISNEKLLEMVTQVEQLNAEVARLRGELDVQSYNLQTMQKRQNDLYSDLDLRLGKLESAPSPAAAAKPAAAEEPASAKSADAKQTAAKPVDPKQAEEATQTYERALTLLREREFPKAIWLLKTFPEKHPGASQQADAQYWLGAAYAADRQWKPAISTHTDFISKYASHPKAPDALRNIGNCQRELGDLSAARATWNKLLKQFPNSEAAGKAKQQLAALKEG